MTLLDTNIVIDLLGKADTRPGKISIFIFIEILRGVSPDKGRLLKENLEELYDVRQVSNEVVLEYCRVYTGLVESGEIIPDIDILIAATAIASGDDLISNDIYFPNRKIRIRAK